MFLIGESNKTFGTEIAITSVSSWSATAPAVIDLDVFHVFIHHELFIMVYEKTFSI